MTPQEYLKIAEQLVADARARASAQVATPESSLDFVGQVVAAIREAVGHLPPAPVVIQPYVHQGVVVLREQQLCQMLNLSSNSVLKLRRKDPTFPKRRKIVGDVEGWLSEEVEEWLRSRPASARDEREGVASGAPAQEGAPRRGRASHAGVNPVKRNVGAI